MKQQTSILLTIAAAIGAACLIKRKKEDSGVGATTQFISISKLQQKGVDFYKKWDELSEYHQAIVADQAKAVRYRQTKRSEGLYTYGEAFYRSLLPLFKKAISGLAPIGNLNLYDEYSTDKFIEYPIRNANGDIVLVYHDLNDFPMLRNVISEWYDPALEGRVRNEVEAFNAAICYIAHGGKFIWSDEKRKGLLQELFAGGGSMYMERRQYIDIIAKKGETGATIMQLAERWTGATGADMEARNGIMDALMTVRSQTEAKEYIRQHALDRIDDLTPRVQWESTENYEAPFERNNNDDSPF